jgi:uncharacterized protein
MNAFPRQSERLCQIMLDDIWHREALEVVRAVAPFAWITGGFVRSAIWDTVFHCRSVCRPADVDVVYLVDGPDSLIHEDGLKSALAKISPRFHWSVRDQNRMHLRNGDAPYANLEEALQAFPDTSSAIAVRLTARDDLEVLAPFGLGDAFEGLVRPTPAGQADDRYGRFLARKSEGWQERWPWLTIVPSATPPLRSRHAA